MRLYHTNTQVSYISCTKIFASAHRNNSLACACRRRFLCRYATDASITVGRQTAAFAGKDVTSSGSINDPLGMTIAPNGDILTVNGNNGLIVETTPGGNQIARKLLGSTGSPPGAGCLFGVAVVPDRSGVYFVDDCDNTLKLLH